MASILDQVRQEFPCTQCGLCCKNVFVAQETRYLDRGDGVCRHYSEASKQCSIYSERPDICRVDKQYQLHYSSKYAWYDFVAINLRICHQLQHNDV
jgi:uncharacterized protein